MMGVTPADARSMATSGKDTAASAKFAISMSVEETAPAGAQTGIAFWTDGGGSIRTAIGCA